MITHDRTFGNAVRGFVRTRSLVLAAALLGVGLAAGPAPAFGQADMIWGELARREREAAERLRSGDQRQFERRESDRRDVFREDDRRELDRRERQRELDDRERARRR